MQKYNLAYIPKFKSTEFITITKNYQAQHHNYILGPSSIPHVTICQFYFNEDNIKNLFKRIEIEQLDYNLNLSFKDISHVTFDGIIHWVSLLPQDPDKLENIFNRISKLVPSLRSDPYDPHLTLFNYSSYNKSLNQKMSRQISIQDEFEFVLGICDSFGQLIKVVHTFKMISN